MTFGQRQLCIMHGDWRPMTFGQRQACEQRIFRGILIGKAMYPRKGNEANWTAMNLWQWSQLKQQWTGGNDANWSSNEPLAMKPIEMTINPWQWSQLKWRWKHGNKANWNGNEPVASIEMTMNPWRQLKYQQIEISPYHDNWAKAKCRGDSPQQKILWAWCYINCPS